MRIRRAVPDLTAADLDRSRASSGDFLGFSVGMDMGWDRQLRLARQPDGTVVNVMSHAVSAG